MSLVPGASPPTPIPATTPAAPAVAPTPVLVRFASRFALDRARFEAALAELPGATRPRLRHWLARSRACALALAPAQLAAVARLDGVAAIEPDLPLDVCVPREAPPYPVSPPPVARAPDALPSSSPPERAGARARARLAVLDTGCEPEVFGSLVAGSSSSSSWLDLTDEAAREPTDAHGHGSAVAAAVHAAFLERVETPDAALPVPYLVARVLGANGAGWSSDVLAALERAECEGAEVIVLALGTDVVTDGGDLLSRAVDRLGERALIVAAAGNRGPGRSTVLAPAVARGALAVGAAGEDGRALERSSRGPAADGRPKPDLVASVATGDRARGALGGTSRAAARVAGAAAAALALLPRLPASQLRPLLLESTLAVPLDRLAVGRGVFDAGAFLSRARARFGAAVVALAALFGGVLAADAASIRSGTVALDYRNRPGIGGLAGHEYAIVSAVGYAHTAPLLAGETRVLVSLQPFVCTWRGRWPRETSFAGALHALAREHGGYLADTTGARAEVLGSDIAGCHPLDFRDPDLARAAARLVTERFRRADGLLFDYGCQDLAWEHSLARVDPGIWEAWADGYRLYREEIRRLRPDWFLLCQCDALGERLAGVCDGLALEKIGNSLNPFPEVWRHLRETPGRHLLLVETAPDEAPRRRRLASALALVTGSLYAHRVRRAEGLVNVPDREHFEAELGEFVEEAREIRAGVWRRRAQHGYVLLNLSNRPVEHEAGILAPNDAAIVTGR